MANTIIKPIYYRCVQNKPWLTVFQEELPNLPSNLCVTVHLTYMQSTHRVKISLICLYSFVITVCFSPLEENNARTQEGFH